MLTFVGRINGNYVNVHVLLKDQQVTVVELMLTLDQWDELRKIDNEQMKEEYDPVIWVTTKQGYQDSVGEPLEVA